ncbi:MAG: hypothetical protein ACRCZB_05415 [Bacteroidales bacterium]
MAFRRRQQQVASLIQQGKLQGNIGVLDFPFCAFRLTSDAISPTSDRTWINQSLNVEGIWLEDIQRKVRLTPATLTYEVLFLCQADIDLHYITQKFLWLQSNETLIEAFIDTEDNNGVMQTIKNIVVVNITTHMNDSYTESDWLEKNRIQTMSVDIPCGTWLMGDDRKRYALTKKVIFEFIESASLPIKIEEDVNQQEAEQAIYETFSSKGIWGNNDKPL